MTKFIYNFTPVMINLCSKKDTEIQHISPRTQPDRHPTHIEEIKENHPTIPNNTQRTPNATDKNSPTNLKYIHKKK